MTHPLLQKFAGGTRRPVDAARLDETERRLGIVFPARLRELFSQTDGLKVDEHRLELMELQVAAAYADTILRIPLGETLGLFPISQSNDSNPFCVCCRPPLFGRVIQLRHDDAPKVAFRDLDGFADGLFALTSVEGWHVDDLVFGYDEDHSDRTPDDDDAAARLLASDCEDEENAIVIALSLMSRALVGVIVDFLSHESMWVREAAAAQLGLLGDSSAIEPLERLARLGSRQDNAAARTAVRRLSSTHER